MPTFRVSHLVASIALTACAVDDALPPPPTSAGPVTCQVPDGFEVQRDSTILVEGDISVGTVAELESDCAAGRPWRGWERAPSSHRLTPYALGLNTSSNSRKWPNGVIPYVIDPTLPDQGRVTDAIEEWNDAGTPIYIRPKTSGDTHWVNFTNGSSCHSKIGMDTASPDGSQDIVLATAESGSDIVGSAISISGDVYTWFQDGLVSAGTTTDLDSVRELYSYKVPSGYTPGDIVGIAIHRTNGRVYAWYANGKFSSGTSSDLAYYGLPANYSLPTGKTTSQIVDMEWDAAGYLHTWFSDGTVSKGTSTDLASAQGPVAFTVATGETVANLRGVAFGTAGGVWAWYSDNKVSQGTRTDLDATLATSKVAAMGGCAKSAVVHEIGHAVGLGHEQNRHDRDDHVRIFLNNVDPDKTYNFDKAGSDLDDIGDYDLTSRMHYDKMAFSINDSPTILAMVLPGLSVSPDDVVDMAISNGGDVYTWWRDGTVTAGHSDDLESVKSRYHYAVPAPYSPGNILGIGFASSGGNVYTYYNDGKFSIGHTDDLAAVAAPAWYSLPQYYYASDILKIDIASTAHVYTWYKNGYVSSGTATDLDAYTAPTPYSLPSGKTFADVLGIAISTSNDWCYVWYASGSASAGSSTDLDTHRTLYNFTSRLDDTFKPSLTLTAGDKAAANAMYAD